MQVQGFSAACDAIVELRSINTEGALVGMLIQGVNNSLLVQQPIAAEKDDRTHLPKIIWMRMNPAYVPIAEVLAYANHTNSDPNLGRK